MDLVYCPSCGQSYYYENYCTRTAVYYPPLYKDGVNINPDCNVTTHHCTCANCGTEFTYKSGGEGYVEKAQMPDFRTSMDILLN